MPSQVNVSVVWLKTVYDEPKKNISSIEVNNPDPNNWVSLVFMGLFL